MLKAIYELLSSGWISAINRGGVFEGILEDIVATTLEGVFKVVEEYLMKSLKTFFLRIRDDIRGETLNEYS